MRIAVFSDVHGNLPALEHFLSQARDEADAWICLGDVVDYGPWNDECLELIASLPDLVLIEGNHERLFRNPDLIRQEIPIVQAFFKHSYSSFSRHDLIENLPESHQIGSFTCMHTIGSRPIYADTDVSIQENMIIGHSHHAFSRELDGHLLINCGSIGQNRKHLGTLQYAVVDERTDAFSLREAPWPAELLLSECRARGYPEICLEYYRSKLAAS